MQQTAKMIADLLTNQLGRPVYDQTGLTGKYDIDLEFAPDPGGGLMRVMGPAPPGDAAGGAPGASDPAGAPSLVTAIQQLGLRLEPAKSAIDIVIIDHAEKVPVEN
jgi:uncharacterized protein (TIGR03435 family)